MTQETIHEQILNILLAVAAIGADRTNTPKIVVEECKEAKKDIDALLEVAEKRGREEVHKHFVPVQKAISEETSFSAGQASERKRIREMLESMDNWVRPDEFINILTEPTQ